MQQASSSPGSQKRDLGWSLRRREDLLHLLGELDRQVSELDAAVGQAGAGHAQARLLMTQPGVGPVTALAFVLNIGDVSRFEHGGQVASYVGLIPREHSSGGGQRLGAISKQGNCFLRQLLVEAVLKPSDETCGACAAPGKSLLLTKPSSLSRGHRELMGRELALTNAPGAMFVYQTVIAGTLGQDRDLRTQGLRG